ncbi:hypothetical protein VHUM_01695 [Vanrija humicola]|uniref:ATP-dependent RNA helicase n=1 Tax=Vanrija humicola TaxID=5417 RepID=A0A7D8ZR33_VANHU|nr:hypothetical protein VHUM_01695 [Vanrija humicola]
MPRPSSGAPAFGSTWASLTPPLTPWIADVIAQQGFSNMTPVQAGTIPRALKNQDCVVEAVTGSGKTLAFVVPVLERIVRSEHKFKRGEVAAIVIAPTRELAAQIHEVFTMFLSTLVPPPPSPVDGEEQPTPIGEYPLPLLVTSGTADPYAAFLNTSANIIVGTPGRLASFLLSPRGLSAVRVGNIDALVLDEADRLLSAPDHRRDVERIMRHLPKQRRTHLFSATMTDAVEDLVGIGLRNPVRIVVNLKDKRMANEQNGTGERRVPMSLQNTFLVCGPAEKTLQLVRVLRREATEYEAAKMIVYFSTGAAVDYFYRVLSKLPELSNFHFASLHGDLPPRAREASLSSFTSHASSHLSPAVLLCTDVAARGVDFNDIDTVIQYDPPTDPKTFSHRVGRTARAGRSGRAVVLLTRGREEQYVDFLKVRKIPLVRQGYITAELGEAETAPEPPVDADALDLLKTIRDVVLTDRDLADRGAKALVSSVQAYTKHEASFIFRPADIDFAALATSFGLLRIPTMPEVRSWRKKTEKAEARRAKGEAPEDDDYTPPVPWTDAEVDWDTFAYASKQREAARVVALAEKKKKREETGADDEARRKKRKIEAGIREAWSNQKERKARREERHDKKDKKKQAEWERKQAAGEATEQDAPVLRAKKAKAKKEDSDDSDDDMGEDYRALRREVNSERAARKATSTKREAVGMFDDLD